MIHRLELMIGNIYGDAGGTEIVREHQRSLTPFSAQF